ncbi:hypothetical protein NT239_15850 [Chitinibacter sp. SCUT-21]|uniref:hypothetical protein n=1 Tax=Chitinibacter sp. SCUT-21 TaxID=2970891 RepID=UPI0035A7089C
MKRIALKIDVDTSQAITVGLPQIIPVLQSHQAGATLFWALGDEKNGSFLRPARYIRRTPGRSEIKLKVRYDVSALLRGSFKPSKNLAKVVSVSLSSLALSAFEHGVRPAQQYDWQNNIMQRDMNQTREAYDDALAKFEKTFSAKVICHAASGWQINRAAFRLHQIHQLEFASDCRGIFPFWPIVSGEYTRCPQIPVTLPMLEELLPKMDIAEAIDHLKQLTELRPSEFHVFNIAADFDVRYVQQLDELFAAWKNQGYDLVSLGVLKQSLDLKKLPYHHVSMQPCPGRYGLLATQADVYP